MLKINNYKLTSNKITKDQSILLIADIHLWDNYNDELIKNVIEKVSKLKPSIICLCGDIIDEFRYLEKENNEQYLLKFLNDLAAISPTLITLGSHDYFNRKALNTGNISYDSIKYWHKLIKKNNNKNLILLDNEIYENLNIRVIGYTPSRDYFKECENQNILIKEINDNFKKISKDNKYTILMCHTPRRINKVTLEKIKIASSIDLVLSGHMHDGLVFPLLKKMPFNFGFISPQKTIFPKNARGKKIIKINEQEVTVIVTGGLMKFSNMAPEICKKFNFLYNNDIDYIKITM